MKIRIKIKWKYSELIVFLLTIMPIIDFINGYFQNTFISLIGPLYRLILILLSMMVLIKSKNSEFVLFTFLISGYFLMHDIIYMAMDKNNNSLSVIMDKTVKYMYVIILSETLCLLVKRNRLTITVIDEIFDRLSWLFPVLLFIPKLMGAKNTSMYTESGYKGFFYSGNAVSITMVALLFVSMCFLYKRPCFRNSVRVFLCLTVQLLIGAKTNYIFSALIIGYFALKSINLTRNNNLKTLTTLILLVFCGFFAIKYCFSDEIAKILARQRYIYSSYNANFIQYLTSNRSIRIDEQLRHFLSNPFYILFGMGYRQTFDNNFVEMDYFDLLFRYGALVTVVLIIYYLTKLREGLRKKDTYLMLYLILQAFATFAGHVFCDAMTGSILALLIAHIRCTVVDRRSEIKDAPRGNCYTKLWNTRRNLQSGA